MDDFIRDTPSPDVQHAQPNQPCSTSVGFPQAMVSQPHQPFTHSHSTPFHPQVNPQGYNPG